MKLPRPAGGLLLCPWLDLHMKSASFVTNASTDFLPDMPEYLKLSYATSEADKTNPFVSPLYAHNLKDLPPLLVQIGSKERLFSENLAFASRAYNDGDVPLKLEVYEV
jgi:epsilon-lactone hydrolase